MAPYEAWWTNTKQDGSRPLWGGSESVQSTLTSATSSQASSSSSSDQTFYSFRALELRYRELTSQLEHCQTWERQLQSERERLVSELLLERKDSRKAGPRPISPPVTTACVSAPKQAAAPAAAPQPDQIEPPSRQQLLVRLIDGQREDYRRIFVPGRGWVSKSKLQSELRVSELELEKLASRASQATV